MLPFLAVAAVGIGLYNAFSDDSPRRRDNSREVKNNYKQEKRDGIKGEIEAFKESSISKMQQQYNTLISFSNNHSVSITKPNVVFKESIDKLDAETKNMEILLQKLQKEQHEAVV